MWQTATDTADCHKRSLNNESESGTQLAQNHAICYYHWGKGHCISDCLMKDKMAKKDWAIKKGMQMTQGLNDKTSKVSKNTVPNNDNGKKEEKKKHVHWSSAQMQGFQSHSHVQLHQGNANNKEKECT